MKLLHSFLSLTAMAVASMIGIEAHAQITNVTLHEGENQLPAYVAVDATFTPTENCKVLIESEDMYLVTYNDHTYTYTYLPANTPPNQCEIDNVEAGTTITMHSDFVLGTLVRITVFPQGTVIPVEIMHVSPATGTSNFWANSGLLNITFNKQVHLTGAKLVAGDIQANLEIVHVSSAISINIGTTLNQLLGQGSLHTGDRFQVVISGLCDANDANNLYNGTGTLTLRFIAPDPQYNLISAAVDGQLLTTHGLNPYTFLSYYGPDSEDGVFVLEFDAEVGSVEGAVLYMGNRDLDAQGKYYEEHLPASIEGNKVIVDVRNKLRTLNLLFPAVVEEEPEPGESVNEGLGSYDTEHITLRVSNVIDINGNYFMAQQAGNVGSYSFYMNYRELLENINIDGDNKFAGDQVVAGETIRLWLSSSDVLFDGIQVDYITEVEDGILEPASTLQSEFTTEADPYEGIIISFVMPELPQVAVGQTVRVSLHNAQTLDGMPHDLGIDFIAGDPSLGIEQLHNDNASQQANVFDLNGRRIEHSALAKGTPYISNGTIKINQ